MKLAYCLTRKTLKCNSLVQKIWHHTAKQLCVGSPGTQTLYFWWPLLLEKILWILFQLWVAGDPKFGPLLVKWWYHIFSRIKMEEYMESELSGFFEEIWSPNIVFGSLETPFMHIWVKCCFFYLMKWSYQMWHIFIRKVILKAKQITDR